jgi:UDP-N-acetylglucosamine--N-acetylmuramyl-(pentapeptide) pyrophosphoryl-undecaprenol N-acetylglucosamine transferase
VLVHESDAVPGRVNLFAGKFAEKVAISYEEAAQYFPSGKTALIGIPIRRELRPSLDGAYEFLHLDKEVPILLVMGGSQGAQTINDVLLDVLPDLLNKYQVVHQAGAANVDEIRTRLPVVLQNHLYKDRYKLYGFLSSAMQSKLASITTLAIARAGSTSIFELAYWGIPSIIVPIPKEVSRDQYRNAYNYARTGAAVLLEQGNITPHILSSEIYRIMDNQLLRASMKEHALAFAKPNAAHKMAEAILSITLGHEQ